MIETGNQLTEKAQEWCRDHISKDGFTDKDNPFYNDRSDGLLRLSYDEIRITNFSKVDGVGVWVNYYWGRWKVCMFPVNNISLDMAPTLSYLNLNGINGSMKIVIIDDGQTT